MSLSENTDRRPTLLSIYSSVFFSCLRKRTTTSTTQFGLTSTSQRDNEAIEEDSIELREKGKADHNQSVSGEDKPMASAKVKSRTIPVSNDDTTASTGFSYNTGFGDFCFGRFIDSYLYRANSRVPDDGMIGNVIFKELNDFKRHGPFPFFKLPIEIRFMVYGVLLVQFFEFDYDVKTELIKIKLDHFCNYRNLPANNLYSGDYDNYLSIISQSSGMWQDNDLFAGAPKDKSIFEKEKRLDELRNAPHPHRSQPYLMSCTPRIPGGGKKVDWSMIDLIRKLSNVSRRLRYELGEVFWTNTLLQGSDHYSPAVLQNFVIDRPAALSKIKHLRFKVTADDRYGRVNRKENELRLYQNMSKYLELDTLVLELEIGETLFAKLAEGETLWFLVFRTFKVAKIFELETFIIPKVYFEEVSDDWRYVAQLHKKYLNRVEDFLMPDTLRGKQPLTLT
ncbi:hypothetical protein N431DRAFT_458425 [Stipitochalara longipes BDJ]|nr:hypothetical protein N431DRAFT_458425 [Stipitochalara longipes BDJ]